MDTGGRIFVKTTQLDRNDCLIGVTDKAIKETQQWEEARVTIDIALKEVDLTGIFFCFDPESYKEDYELKLPPELDIQLDHIKYEDFNKAVDEINKQDSWVSKDSGMVVSHIE